MVSNRCDHSSTLRCGAITLFIIPESLHRAIQHGVVVLVQCADRPMAAIGRLRAGRRRRRHRRLLTALLVVRLAAGRAHDKTVVLVAPDAPERDRVELEVMNGGPAGPIAAGAGDESGVSAAGADISGRFGHLQGGRSLRERGSVSSFSEERQFHLDLKPPTPTRGLLTLNFESNFCRLPFSFISSSSPRPCTRDEMRQPSTISIRFIWPRAAQVTWTSGEGLPKRLLSLLTPTCWPSTKSAGTLMEPSRILSWNLYS